MRRVNRLRLRRAEVRRELSELERQFVEDDLVVRRGPRHGRPIAPTGRRRRLVDLAAELRRLNSEDRFARSNLDRMNQALTRWARETYGA